MGDTVQSSTWPSCLTLGAKNSSRPAGTRQVTPASTLPPPSKLPNRVWHANACFVQLKAFQSKKGKAAAGKTTVATTNNGVTVTPITASSSLFDDSGKENAVAVGGSGSGGGGGGGAPSASGSALPFIVVPSLSPVEDVPVFRPHVQPQQQPPRNEPPPPATILSFADRVAASMKQDSSSSTSSTASPDKERLGALKIENDELRKELSDMVESYEGLKADYDKSKSALQKHHQDASALRSELETTKAAMQKHTLEFQQQLQEYKGQADSAMRLLEADNDSRSKQLARSQAALRSDKESFDVQIVHLKKALDERDKVIADTRADFETKQAQLSQTWHSQEQILRSALAERTQGKSKLLSLQDNTNFFFFFFCHSQSSKLSSKLLLN